MLRLTLISLALALLTLSPALAEQLNFILPARGIIIIPAIGIDYMATFFHELGHSITWWLFGSPALPSFDFQNGGGMSYDFDRSWFIQGCVFAGLAGGLLVLWRRSEQFLFTLLAILTVVILALAFNDGHEILATYMGHGGEILIACFCLLRGLTNMVEGKSAIERYLNMVFALHTLGRNIILSCSLMFSDVGRMAYDMQKGGHVQGDFRNIADTLNMGISTVAGLSLVFMFVFVTSTLVIAIRHGENQ